MARVKREGQERDEDDDDSDESTDEDFNPEGQESDVAEEYVLLKGKSAHYLFSLLHLCAT